VEIVIGFTCMGIAAGLNLVLVLALHRRLDGLPSRVVNLAARERADGERKGMSALQEMAAARVGAIVKSLRQHEEQVAASFRSQVAEAEVRAHIAERQASEAGVALSTAVVLVRELRGLRNGKSEEGPPKDEGERLSEDQMTCVVSRALPGVSSAKEGAR